MDVERPGSSTPAPRGVDPVTGEREGGPTPGPLVNCPPSTPGQQHYSLRWNNHQHHLLNAFELLLQVLSSNRCSTSTLQRGLFRLFVHSLIQGVRGHWAVNYNSPQSF